MESEGGTVRRRSSRLRRSSVPRAAMVSLTREELIVEFVDGRRLAVPLAWFPRLLRAKTNDRRNWELLGDGVGIHWPVVDEDLSVAGLLAGNRTPNRRGSGLRPRVN
jgi:hypothetical protein